MFPALAGRLFTTEPPGESRLQDSWVQQYLPRICLCAVLCFSRTPGVTVPPASPAGWEPCRQHLERGVSGLGVSWLLSSQAACVCAEGSTAQVAGLVRCVLTWASEASRKEAVTPAHRPDKVLEDTACRLWSRWQVQWCHQQLCGVRNSWATSKDRPEAVAARTLKWVCHALCISCLLSRWSLPRLRHLSPRSCYLRPVMELFIMSPWTGFTPPSFCGFLSS